jgi:SAM-dependent methyltransferase
MSQSPKVSNLSAPTLSAPTVSAIEQVTKHWNAVYSSKEYEYGEAPNAWLASIARRFPAAGRAVALADGYGRNGVFLAECGLKTLSLDISPVGVETTRKLAAKRGVEIDAQVMDVSKWQPEGPVYDVVALIYAHFSSTPDRDYCLRRQIHQAAAEALKPGGLLILEAFRPDQLGKGSGGPKSPHYLYSLDALRQDFARLRLLEGAEVDIILEEGERHRGLASVVRLLATKD